MIKLLLILLPMLAFGQGKDEISKGKLRSKFNAAAGVKAEYTLDESALVLRQVKDAAKDKQGQGRDAVEIVLGDRTAAEFTPQIELRRWDEAAFKLRPRMSLGATAEKDLVMTGARVQLKSPTMDFEMFAPDADNYKYVWYLNERPSTNRFEFDIESQNLEFFYQPALTAEELARGDLRPENVVGSYAVYHATKGRWNDGAGKAYGTGKAFHIYRPHILDSAGRETWGVLDITGGTYSVTIPQEFLDSATYPVKSNDTFGITSYGASQTASAANYWYGIAATPGSSGTITSVSQYGDGTASFNDSAFKGAVTDSSGTLLTNGVGAAVSVLGANSAQWYTSTYSTGPSITGSTEYRIGSVVSNALFYMWHDTTSGYQDSSNSYASPTSPTDATGNSMRISIYATYTPGGAERRRQPVVQ